MVEEESYEVGKKMLFYTVFMLIMLVIFVAMMMFLGSYTQKSLYTSQEIESKIYSTIYKERFFSSAECFAYQDAETGNVYPGIIDKSKFSEERLNECYKPNEESKYEFLLTLVDQGKETTIQTQEFVFLKKKSAYFTLVYDNGEIRPVTLFVVIQHI